MLQPPPLSPLQPSSRSLHIRYTLYILVRFPVGGYTVQLFVWFLQSPVTPYSYSYVLFRRGLYRVSGCAPRALQGRKTMVAAAAVWGQTRVRPTSETGPRRDSNDVIHDGIHGYGRQNDVIVNPASWSGTARGIH